MTYMLTFFRIIPSGLLVLIVITSVTYINLGLRGLLLAIRCYHGSGDNSGIIHKNDRCVHRLILIVYR